MKGLRVASEASREPCRRCLLRLSGAIGYRPILFAKDKFDLVEGQLVRQRLPVSHLRTPKKLLAVLFSGGLLVLVLACSGDENADTDGGGGSGANDEAGLRGNLEAGSDATSSPAWPTGNAYPDDPAVMAIIDAMGDNTSVELEPFHLAGDRVDEWVTNYGTAPQRRDYCNKIAYAPDRGTGMYAGMNHGAPHRLDDTLEYHLGSNTWYLLFFPHPELSKQPVGWLGVNAMMEDGYLQTRQHGIVAGVHTWDALTYDPVTHRMLWANSVDEDNGVILGNYNNASVLSAFATDTGQTLEQVKAQQKPGTRVRFYDPVAGRWHRQIGEGSAPTMIAQGAALEYIPDLGKSIWYTAQWNESGMWAYDSTANLWTALHPSGGKNPYHDNSDFTFPPNEAQMRYGSATRTLVAVRGERTWHYSIDKNEWSPIGEDQENFASDNRTAFSYDSKNDVFLLVQPEKQSIRAYHPSTRTWETLSVNGPPVRSDMAVASYYDVARNALVVLDRKKCGSTVIDTDAACRCSSISTT